MSPAEALHKYFGYTEFRHRQEEIVQRVLGGGDALVLMPTGGGKSLCYQLPAMLLPGLTLVISPLIALMKDQVDALNINGMPAAFLNSSQGLAEQRETMMRVRTGEIRLLYLAPERLFAADGRMLEMLKSVSLSLVAIDEAHCISHWGHDFRPEYLMLANLKVQFPGVPVIALTATADEMTRRDIREKLALHHPAEFVSSFNRANITYRVAPKQDAYEKLLTFLEAHSEDSGIIYCLSRQGTEDLARRLRDEGYPAAAYHAGLEGETKARNQEQFLRDEIRIVVATIAFGMGINKSNVRYVVHYDLPKNVEGYYQETGRAGRDGLPSEAVLFFSAGDAIKLKRFAQVDGNEEQSRIMLRKLDDMVRYCQLHTCRRQYLLRYFNEEAPDNCGSCDICLAQYKVLDGTILAQKALSAVVRLQQRFGINYVIDLLRGSKSEKMREEHKQLKTYGVGADVSKADWQNYIAQLISQGYLRLTEDDYPILKLTETSDSVLRGGQKVEFHLVESTSTALGVEAAEYEHDLFQKLKLTRHELAVAGNVPAYIVLSDATLLEMATYLPQNLAELAQISGFGEVKLERYGAPFVEVMTVYCAERGLASRMGGRRQKPVRNRSPRSGTNATQRESFDLYKSGLSIQQIAAQRNLSVVTIESHLCAFIVSGEIDVSEIVTPAKRDRIQDAVKAHGAERLAPLKELLGENISYAEIKATVAWMGI